MNKTDTLDITSTTPGWVVAAAEKVARLEKLPPNWDSYGGLPLQPGPRELAFRILAWLANEDLPVPLVGLGSAGTVNLEWNKEERSLEVECLSDNSIGYLKVHSDGTMDEGVVDANLSVTIRQLSRWLSQGTDEQSHPVNGGPL